LKALVKYARGKGNVRVMEVERPPFGPEDLLIRVHFCGLCGTDIHIFEDEFPNDPPVILGHEFCGEVVEVGSGLIKEWKEGDRVVGELHTGACRRCYLCRKGAPHICEEKRPIGSRRDGALAEYIALPGWLAHPVPAGVSSEVAALAEPLAITCHALMERGRVSEPEVLVVLGSSTVGLFALLVASSLGAEKILVSGTGIDERLRFRLARQLGASETINVEKGSLEEAVARFSGGAGADVVVECSGSEEAIISGIEVVRKTGKFILLGLTSEESPHLPWNRLLYKEVNIVGCFSSPPSSWMKALEHLVSLEENLKKLITQVIRLREWEKGFELMRTGQAVKVLVDLRRT